MSLYSKLCLLFNLALYISFYLVVILYQSRFFSVVERGQQNHCIFICTTCIARDIMLHCCCHEYIVIISCLCFLPGSCRTCPWGIMCGTWQGCQRASDLWAHHQRFSPIPHTQAVMFALLELSHLPSWRFNPLSPLYFMCITQMQLWVISALSSLLHWTIQR